MGIFPEKLSSGVVLSGRRQALLFRTQIQGWYEAHHRALPWRGLRDPYKIWVSEMILQQTRISQGLPYYERILAFCPTLESFARASESDILGLWQGMGYYRRAQYMHETAKVLVAKYRGTFPSDPKTLQRLKGIGPYTAAAIASLAFDVPVPVLDGNVFRVVARVFGKKDNIHKPATRTKFYNLLLDLIDQQTPGKFNQALMELGALVCTPKPHCSTCCVQNLCIAYHHKQVEQLPCTSKKKTIKTRYLHYVVFVQGHHHYYLRKRSNDDIWASLYDFYLLEGDTNWSRAHIRAKLKEAHCPLEKADTFDVSGPYVHLLTHQRLRVYFFRFRFQHRPELRQWLHKQGLKKYAQQALPKVPKPVLIQKYLQNQKKFPILTEKGACNQF